MIRELLGTKRRTPSRVENWLGITADEWHRMRSSDVKYIVNVYPIADRRMSRNACLSWLEGRGQVTGHPPDG